MDDRHPTPHARFVQCRQRLDVRPKPFSIAPTTPREAAAHLQHCTFFAKHYVVRPLLQRLGEITSRFPTSGRVKELGARYTLRCRSDDT